MEINFVKYDEKYLSLSWRWLNDPEIKQLTETPDFTKESQRVWFDSLGARTDYFVWGVECDGVPVGVVGMRNVDTQKGEGEYFGYIGEKNFWGHGVGREMMDFTFKKACEMKLSFLHLWVNQSNTRALKLYEKSGFMTDSVLNGHVNMSMYVRAKIFSFRQLGDARGDMTVAEAFGEIPFTARRIFYMTDTSGDSVRGLHANRFSSFMFIVLSGQCTIDVFDGFQCERFLLDKKTHGLFTPKMLWKEMHGFSNDCILLVLSDKNYDANEYIRDKNAYTNEMKKYFGED